MNEHHLIEKHLKDYVALLHDKIHRYTTELNQQLSSYPFTSISYEIIDLRLKEFVRLHHIDLLRTVNYQVNKFRDHIQEKELSQQLESFPSTSEQARKNHHWNIYWLCFDCFDHLDDLEGSCPSIDAYS